MSRIDRQTATAVVSLFLNELAKQAPAPMQKKAMLRSRLYLALCRDLDIPDKPAANVPPVLHDLDECYKLEGGGDYLFLAIKGEIFVYGDSVDRTIERIGKAKKIDLGISSLGGCSSAALRIHKALTEAVARGVEVTATVHKMAASAAGIILQAASKRIMFPDGYVMVHSGRAFLAGTYSEIAAEVQRLQLLDEQTVALFCASTGKSEQVVRAWHEKDTWFSATEALENGLIDEIKNN